jgi:hypothetical protein
MNVKAQRCTTLVEGAANPSVTAQHGINIRNAAGDYAINNGRGTTNPYCTGRNVTVNQAYPITKGPTTIVASPVVASCSYQFKIMPNLPGFSVPHRVTLQGTAVFSNLY